MRHLHNRLPASERREQILAVAMGLFARRGFEGTTTRQVAECAGVNEAILFRHFPRKEDLYWAILDGKSRSAGAREQLEARLRAAEDEKEAFAAVAEDILRRNSEDPTLGRLLLFSALENHRLSHRFFRTHIARYYESLGKYIRQGIRAGRFRPVDPLVAARGFLGMIVYHFLIQELFGGRRYQKFDTRLVCRTLAEIWLEGMRVSRRPRAQAQRMLRPQDARSARVSKKERG